jgi:ribosome-binding protein aMBF1 (putative translation factor)
MKASDLPTTGEVLADALRDQAFRREWQRTALAGAVALRLVEYRAEHGLSQRALAAKLGMKQPAIARLEAGDHTPSIDTLVRLSRGLGMRFRLEISPEELALGA